MLINNAVITGSFIVNGVDVTGITGSSNVSSSYLALSASFLVTSASYASASGSLSTRVTNLEATSSTVSSSFATTSGSLSTRVTNLESTSSVVSSSFATTSGSIAGRVTLIEGQYATTGSNNFTKPQQISDVSNAISFTSTASLYTDGGLRVKGSSFISGTAYFNDVVVYGTSSIEYITSSQLAIGTNIITLNTDTPSIRFGGISVFDSGSNNLSTGSLFWDSEKDKWIYSNPSASTYDGGMLISGPRNSSGLGNEVGTTSCALMMGQGGDHITSSAIFSYGNATCFYGNSFISSSGAACFASDNIIAGNLYVGNTSTSSFITLTGNSVGGFTAGNIYWGSGNQTTAGIHIDSPGTNLEITTGFNERITLSTGTGLQLYTNNGGGVYTSRLLIDRSGNSCFSGNVCAPAFVGGTVDGTIINSTSNAFRFSGNNALSLVSLNAQNVVKINAAGYWGIQLVGANDQGILINNSGNVGIRTTSPSYPLDVCTSASGDQIVARFNNSPGTGNEGAFIGFSTGYSGAFSLIGAKREGAENDASLIFAPMLNEACIERMRITSAGVACFSCTICSGGSIARKGYDYHTGGQWYKIPFYMEKGNGVGNADTKCIVVINNNDSFQEMHFTIEYGSRLQGVSDATTQTSLRTYGVNRFNSGTIAVTDTNLITGGSGCAINTHAPMNVGAVGTCMTVVKVDFSSSLGNSSFVWGEVRIWSIELLAGKITIANNNY